MFRLFLQAAVLAAAVCVWPGQAGAHAILVDSQPAAQSKMPPGPASIMLRFNSRIDRVRSRLALRAGGSETLLSVDPAGPADRLDAITTLAPGDYTIRWQVLAVDGHITRGDVPFSVQGR